MLNNPQPITFGRHTVADMVPGEQLKIENPISFNADRLRKLKKNKNKTVRKEEKKNLCYN
jgi:hypothetical protein